MRERVPAPAEVRMPDPVDGVVWRPATPEDAPGITALLEAMSRRDHPDWSESLAEVEDDLGHSWVDLPNDSVLGHDADGALVAWGLVIEMPEPESLLRIILPGGVHPERRGRGLGRRLLAWQRARAKQRLSRSDSILPAWLMSYAPDRAPEHGRLLDRSGFEPSRYFTSLDAVLADADLDRELPAGVRVEPMSAELSEAVRLAKNASFADHWGSQPATVEGWTSMLALPSARPELSRVALADEEVVGFVLTEINEDDWERQGFTGCYIGLVGTVREWRGRGLAGALLADVMRAARDAGLERAVLDVDAENPTGALSVYTRLGFRATSRDVSYRIVY
ncbi:GNAT family N-acetyltransferase [Microcella alkalica]